MRSRAAEVRRPGTYLGLLDWVIWGHSTNTRVVMLFGEATFDVMNIVAPGVGASDPAAAWGVARVAAVTCTGTYGTWLAAVGSLPVVNHYVIGSALPRSERDTPSGGEGRPAVSCAKRAALRAGWMLTATAEDGNCAVDAMAHFQGAAREPKSWQVIRDSIADFMVSHSADAQWQQVALACQEGAAALGPLPVSVSSGSDAWGVPPVVPALPMPDASAALLADDSLEAGQSAGVSDELLALVLAGDEGFKQEDLLAAASSAASDRLERSPGRPEASDELDELLSAVLATGGDLERSHHPQEPSAED